MRTRLVLLAMTTAIAVLLLVQIGMPAAATAGRGGGAPPDSQTLGELAARSGVRVGTAVDMAAFADDTTYRERIAEEFTAVTPETS